jgi:hypothetical protein
MLNVILQLHQIMVPVILTVGGVTLLCGLLLLYLSRAQARDGTARLAGWMRVFRRLLVATAATGVLQAVFGALLLLLGQHPRDNLHFVYGLIVLGAVPVAYVYSDQKQVRRDIIIMVIAAAAVIGAAIRGMMTGA